MPTAALIVGGLGAAGAIGSSFIQSNAAQNASQAQVALGEQALQIQQTLGQQGLNALMPCSIRRGIAQPVIDMGGNVLAKAET
jgi:type II secretory pathway pseudopilin PulG